MYLSVSVFYVYFHASMLSRFSHVWFFVTLWSVAHQTPLYMRILQARILEWVDMPSSRGSSWPSDWKLIYFGSCIAGRFFTTEQWAAAAAKLLQSCTTLCDPIDSRPPGSSVPGILQARIRSGLPFPSPRHACMHACKAASVMPNSVQPHRRQPTRLCCP